MVPFKYAYLFWDVILFIPWLFLFLLRKDLRKEMLMMGVLVAVFSVITGYLFWTVDWWKPETITGTKVGIEDFLMGFLTGGVGAVLYETIFRKRLYRRHLSSHNSLFIFWIALVFAMLSVSFWYFKFTSFVSCVISMIFGLVILMILRRDLFFSALANGILMLTLIIPTYWIVLVLVPHFIDKTWLVTTLNGVKILSIPLEELVFWFLFGLGVAPAYEYWQGLRLRKIVK